MASTKETFIQKLLPHAIAIGAETGISPALIIAQSALETGWGKSVAGNNYFGVKSHGKKGGQTVATHEYVNGKRVSATESFRSYSGVEESMRDYARFLQKNPRYKEVFSADTLEGQITAMGASGYATDPNYGSKLTQIASDVQGITPSAIAAAPFPIQSKIAEAFGAAGGSGTQAALQTTPSLIDGVGSLADVYGSDTRFSRERGITPKQGAIADYVVPRARSDRPVPIAPMPASAEAKVLARTFSQPQIRSQLPTPQRAISGGIDDIGLGASKRDLIDFRFPPANQPVTGGIDRTVQMPPGARPNVRIPTMPSGTSPVEPTAPYVALPGVNPNVVTQRNYDMAEDMFRGPETHDLGYEEESGFRQVPQGGPNTLIPPISAIPQDASLPINLPMPAIDPYQGNPYYQAGAVPTPQTMSNTLAGIRSGPINAPNVLFPGGDRALQNIMTTTKPTSNAGFAALTGRTLKEINTYRANKAAGLL